MLVKILGGIDLFAALVFLLLIFDANLPFQFIAFPAILLLAKGLFILKGDFLSILDVFSSGILFLSVFFTLGSVFLWIPMFFLLSKGVVSFF